MSLVIRNNQSDPANTLDVRVHGEYLGGGAWVDEFVGTVTIPPRTAIGQFHWLYLCADTNASGQAVDVGLAVTPAWAPPPDRPLRRLISAWGTSDLDLGLINACQTDRIVQFGHDSEQFVVPSLYNYTTNGQWVEYDAKRWVPAGLAVALYARLEAMRDLSAAASGGVPGIAQCNIGSGLGGPTPSITQAKGYSGGQFEFGIDWLRCILQPGSTKFFTYVNAASRGRIMASGWELAPGPLPIGSPPPPVLKWDQASAGAYMQVGEDGALVTRTANTGTFSTILGDLPRSSGRRYCEITIRSTTSNNQYLGIGRHTGGSLTGAVTPSDYGGINHGGQPSVGGVVQVNSSSTITYSSGDVVMLAVDFDLGHAWVGARGVWLTTAPTWTFPPGTALVPWTSLYNAGNATVLNGGAMPFVSGRAGFAAWDS